MDPKANTLWRSIKGYGDARIVEVNQSTVTYYMNGDPNDQKSKPIRDFLGSFEPFRWSR